MNIIALILLVVISCTFGEDNLKDNVVDKLKRGRTYDYYDSDNINSDSDESDHYGLKNNGGQLPSRHDGKPSFPSNGNGYVQFPGYNVKPPARFPTYNGNKGLTYSHTPLKVLSPPFPTQAELKVMKDLMKKVSKDSTKEVEEEEEEEGFLMKLGFSKPVLISSIIPLSIIFFTVVPVVIKYLQSSPSMQDMASTIATSKMGRVLTDKEFLENSIDSVLDFVINALAKN
ncbi:uncharacterized protein CDAR_482671 [Caerostris darwini]|uniref:Uncharacterized protein n=1 Tax=Caerostris darwini TaxID=1538125 RepID=A0AAV4RIA0_9ARAC|nr:uncharacterized protein CDAR_482671 [Caerostris darwini]